MSNLYDSSLLGISAITHWVKRRGTNVWLQKSKQIFDKNLMGSFRSVELRSKKIWGDILNFFYEFLWISHKLFQNFFHTSYELLTYFLRIFYTLLINLLQTFSELLTHFLWTSWKQTSYKLIVSFYKLCMHF